MLTLAEEQEEDHEDERKKVVIRISCCATGMREEQELEMMKIFGMKQTFSRLRHRMLHTHKKCLNPCFTERHFMPCLMTPDLT